MGEGEGVHRVCVCVGGWLGGIEGGVLDRRSGQGGWRRDQEVTGE